jgi:CheY-like chemotaxis protein
MKEKMKVLLLEDGLHVAALKHWLEERGYEVDRAADVIEAEKLLELDERYDAAIIDLDMEKRYLSPPLRELAKGQYTGWVFYEHFIRDYFIPHERVIILSALIPDFIKNKPEGYRGEHLITKGTPDFLQQILAQLNTFKMNR